jgi:glyoxylase-like metal-dependent hydrolase (beta-lactamase superfamily II)
MRSRRLPHLAIALASAVAANGAVAAVDMRGILEAEYADIRAGLCPSAALTWAQIGTPEPFPAKDRGVVDGDTLTLGDTTVRFVATPGHTQ